MKNQRKTKFRAWDMEKKEMNTTQSFGDFWDIMNNEYGATFSPKRFVLMQFTGLTDKNGKEIYEGDILQLQADGIHNTKLYKIIFNEKLGHFREESIENEPYQENIYPTRTIIGNIYENPELLKNP